MLFNLLNHQSESMASTTDKVVKQRPVEAEGRTIAQQRANSETLNETGSVGHHSPGE